MSDLAWYEGGISGQIVHSDRRAQAVVRRRIGW